MEPRKKTSNMVWVVKSKMTTEKNTASVMSDSYLLSDSLKTATDYERAHTLSSHWSLLPEELLHIISSKLENCFDFIPFPSSPLLHHTRYSLPSFEKFPRKRKGFCTLEKFPLFLFRLRRAPDDASLPSEFFVGGIRQEDHAASPSPYGDEELYLVERIIVRNGVLCFSKLACRVSVLDEEAGEWVVVSDLGDRVLLIGRPGNCSGNATCSAKELPDGCGVSGSSMLFIDEIFDVTYPYKYGVDTGNHEDDLNFWRCSRETRVTITNKSPMVAMRLEQAEP